MIYLFNSGYRPNYVQNVVDTLFYPKGWMNNYRYRYMGGSIYVDVAKIPAYKKFKNEDVIIIYIDRFGANGYVYHPLRTGKLKSCFDDGDKLFFNVELCDFIYPQDNDAFNVLLKAKIPTIPKLVNSNPTEVNDGYYVNIAEDLIADKSKFLHQDTAWDSITTKLSQVKAFMATTTLETIFARISLDITPSKQTIHSGKQKSYTSYFDVTKGDRYPVNFFYKYPNQKENNQVVMEMTTEDSIKIIGQEAIPLNNYTNNHMVEFLTKKFNEENTDKIQFNFKREVVPAITLIAPTTAIPLKISAGWKFWIQVVITMLLLLIANILTTFDYTKLQKNTLAEFFGLLSYWKLIGAFVNAFALVWIFRLWGNKKPV